MDSSSSSSSSSVPKVRKERVPASPRFEDGRVYLEKLAGEKSVLFVEIIFFASSSSSSGGGIKVHQNQGKFVFATASLSEGLLSAEPKSHAAVEYKPLTVTPCASGEEGKRQYEKIVAEWVGRGYVNMEMKHGVEVEGINRSRSGSLVSDEAIGSSSKGEKRKKESKGDGSSKEFKKQK